MSAFGLIAGAVLVIGQVEQVPRATLIADVRYAFDARLPLTQVAGMAVGPSDQLYVADASEGRIGVYDSAGRLAGVFGRPGEGPGEFRRLASIGVLGDTLWAVDQGLRRVVLFDTDGRHLATIGARRDVVQWPGSPESVVPRAVLRRGMIATQRLETGSVGQQQLLLLGGTGELLTQLAVFSLTKERLVVQSERATSVSTYQPLNDSPLWAHSPDGSQMVVVDRTAATESRSARLTVTVTRADGTRASLTTCTYRPAPVRPEAESAFIGEAVKRHRRMFGSQREAEAAVRRSLYLPAFYPPVEDLAYDSSGRIWLRATRISDTDESTWLLLQPSGTVTLVAAPSNFTVHSAAGSVVYGLERDEYDALHVARYRLTPATASSQMTALSEIECAGPGDDDAASIQGSVSWVGYRHAEQVALFIHR